jgi:hypothetical protein
MLKLSGNALALVTVLFFTQAAAAADQYAGPPRGQSTYAPAPAAYPYLLPPCRDAFWNVLLQCAPRAALVVPYDDVYLQNQIRGLRPVTRKPYIQVFTW